jgi:CBS domain-containing protein
MTVRSILDTKGHDILSVEPDSKLSAAVKMLSERRIGAVLVMSNGRIEGILSRDRRTRRRRARRTGK